jgi:hypothetical protein
LRIEEDRIEEDRIEEEGMDEGEIIDEDGVIKEEEE